MGLGSLRFRSLWWILPTMLRRGRWGGRWWCPTFHRLFSLKNRKTIFWVSFLQLNPLTRSGALPKTPNGRPVSLPNRWLRTFNFLRRVYPWGNLLRWCGLNLRCMLFRCWWLRLMWSRQWSFYFINKFWQVFRSEIDELFEYCMTWSAGMIMFRLWVGFCGLSIWLGRKLVSCLDEFVGFWEGNIVGVLGLLQESSMWSEPLSPHFLQTGDFRHFVSWYSSSISVVLHNVQSRLCLSVWFLAYLPVSIFSWCAEMRILVITVLSLSGNTLIYNSGRKCSFKFLYNISDFELSIWTCQF